MLYLANLKVQYFPNSVCYTAKDFIDAKYDGDGRIPPDGSFNDTSNSDTTFGSKNDNLLNSIVEKVYLG